MAHAQVPNPPVYASGPFGPGGIFPMFNTGTLVFASDADRTMSYPEMSAYFLRVTSNVPLTATRRLVAPLTGGFTFAIENATTGGQAIQIIGSSGSGVTVPNGAMLLVACDGTNYVKDYVPPAVTSFSAPAANWPSWLVPSVANSTSTPQLTVAASPIPNSALANSSTTVNGQNCPLGGGCTVSTSGWAGLPHDVSLTRTYGTSYQNSSTAAMWVTGYGLTVGSSTGSIAVDIGPTSGLGQPIFGASYTATINSGKAPFGFWVPSGYWYAVFATGAVVGSNAGLWVEYY